MKQFISQWKEALEKERVVSVATVMSGLGSRPREDGAQMLVLPSGRIVETVGGGRLEADVINCANNVLLTRMTQIHHFELTGQNALMTDMICGGTGDVLVYCSGGQDLAVLDGMLALHKLSGWLCYPVDSNEGIAYLSKEGASLGPEQLKEEALGWDDKQDQFLVTKNGSRYLVKHLQTQGKLHIMGAGHVSLEIAKFSYLVGMDCIVYDDRAEFVNKDRFPDAQCVLLDDMAKPPETVLSPRDMIAIVTRGHIYDMENLNWALHTAAGYIGMIGSRRKSGMIFEVLLEKGIKRARLDQVHTPIGLKIGAQTPSEIAISVVAELIAFRHGKLESELKK